LFDFECCSLAQEMDFVDHYLPYFRQRLITHPLSAFLPFQPLFTESSHGDQLLAPPSFSGVLSANPPLCCVLVFSSLFIVQFGFFFLVGRGCQYAQGDMLIYPGGIPHNDWWSPVGLPNVFHAGLEPASGSVTALLFSQCNVAWRSFPRAGGSGC
jgi:hypothetical protein